MHSRRQTCVGPHEQRERTGPEVTGKRACPTREPPRLCRRELVARDQRDGAIARAPFHREEPGHGPEIPRIGGQPVQGVGGIRNDAPVANHRRRLGDRRRVRTTRIDD